MLVVCGKTVEEIRAQLAVIETAIANGATMGCGGLSVADAERGLSALADYLSPDCGCPCGGSCLCHCEDDEDEEIEECPDDYTVDELVEILRARAEGEFPTELVDWDTDEIAKAIIENI